VRDLFLLDPDVVFLNHGAFGACPRPVFEEYERLQRELERSPVEFLGRSRGFPSLIAAARERLAGYVGAAAADLILVTNATVAVNAVARALDLKAGDEVVATTHEYGGMELLWRAVCESRAARYVEVDTRPSTALDDLLGAFTPRTRALFLSHITSPTALRFPVEGLCTGARSAGVLSVVDGAHAPGQIALDIASIGADFYAGNCHKWLCAPKGAGFLYVRPEAQALVEPPIVSWDWPEAAWGDRFRWTGTHDPSPHLAVPAAIDFQAAHCWDEVRARCHSLAALAARKLAELLGTEPFPERDDEFVQMVSVRLPPCGRPRREARARAPHRGGCDDVARRAHPARVVPGLQRRGRPRSAARGPAESDSRERRHGEIVVQVSNVNYVEAAEFRSQLRRFLRRSEEISRRHGLTPRQYLLLLMIRASEETTEPATIGHLVDRLALTQSTVTELVQRAEEAGLVGRRQSPDDGRVAYLSLTSLGAKRLQGAFEELGPERAQLAQEIRYG
jgi:isopenicillin-N epimerase